MIITTILGAAVIALAAQTPAAPAGGCASALIVELHRESFTEVSDEVVDLGDRTGDLVVDAANRLCRADRLAPAGFADFQRLLIQNGEGADNAVVYVDEAEQGPRTLIFQYAFGDSPPPPGDIEEALLCWSDPGMPVCAERLP